MKQLIAENGSQSRDAGGEEEVAMGAITCAEVFWNN